MQEIYQKIPELIENGETGAYCTVVETKGSTPQKSGAKLLILPDLQNIGTLGGGCVEAEARQQAIDLIRERTTRLLDFQLDNDYGWDDGLICGGQMKIFIDLPTSKTEQDLFDSLQRLSVQKVALYVATVVESEDTEVQVGQKRLVAANGETVGNLGRTTLETEVHQVASEVLQTNEPLLFKWNSRNGIGPISVFIEPIQSRSTLLIAGAGHIGQALCHLGNWTDFDVTVIDDRADLASERYLPDANQIIIGDIATELSQYPIDHLTYVVIVTRGHNHDEEALHAVINSEACYIGLIGSRRKIKLIFDDLIEMGISPERLAQIYAPIGLDISSKTVPEIAVSIASQLIQVRNSAKSVNRFESKPKRMPTIQAAS